MNNTNKFPRGVEVVAGALIRNKEGKLLFTKSPKWSGKWVLPGGHIDPGETIIDAATREVFEETRLSVQFITQIHSGELINPPYFHRPMHMIFFTLLFQTDDDSPILDGVELTEYGWFSPEEALKIPFSPPNESVLKKYIEYVKKETLI